MDLPTMLAVEETTDFLADLVTDGLLQSEPQLHRPHVREAVRQEFALCVDDAVKMILGVPDCEAEYERGQGA